MKISASAKAFFGFAALSFAFYPMLWFGLSASLAGDHLEQHYPWAYFLAKSVKEFHFPYWTDLIQTGFPITAESQMGAFYPPNLILYLLLPFRLAYSYLNVIHFLIAAQGTFLYARQMRMTPLAAFVTGCLFLFGSAYGGAYYNLTSLKTLAWFPVMLFLFEKFLERRLIRHLAVFSVCLAFSVLAGYLQVAFLGLAALLLYVFLRVSIFFDGRPLPLGEQVKVYGCFFIALVLGVLPSLPQIWLTYGLAIESTRVGLSKEYAYVGSLSPFAFFTLLLPNLQSLFRGNCFYVGTFSFILLLVGFFSRNTRRSSVFRLWVCVVAVTLLLALGRWSPLYVAIVELTRLSFFRTPMKFIVFSVFGFCILSGLGFDHVWTSTKRSGPNSSLVKAGKTYFAVLSFLGISGLLLSFAVTAGRPLMMQVGEWAVGRFVVGKAGHPHPLEVYQARLAAIPDAMISHSLDPNFWNIWSWIMLLGGAAFAWTLLKRNIPGRKWVYLGLAFLMLDLYVFSFRDIKRDFLSYRSIDESFSHPLVRALINEKEAGRVGRLYGYRSMQESLPLVPSMNMLLEIPDIGAYSPLVFKRYHETVGQLGNVNDSNFSYSPSVDFVLSRTKLIDFLGVTHILSSRSMLGSPWQLEAHDPVSGAYLYRNEIPVRDAFFFGTAEAFDSWEGLKEEFMKPGFNPATRLLMEASELKRVQKVSGRADAAVSQAEIRVELLERGAEERVWRVEANRPGFLVFPETWDRGWRAELDLKPVPVLRANGLFQAIYIEVPGTRRVRLVYTPFRKPGWPSS